MVAIALLLLGIAAMFIRPFGMPLWLGPVIAALVGLTAGGAAALRRVDIGIVSTGARADLIVLDTNNPIDFVYRPGIPLVASTIIGGSTF